jgi:hypothetical protein
LFTFFSPGRWMTISDGNRCWFSEPHELHAINLTSRKFVIDYEPGSPHNLVCLSASGIVPSKIVKI